MSLAKGEQLGPYEILDRIGAGGMGEVWRARDTRLQRDVAIKRFLGRQNSRFEQEARAVAALNHPNICQIYDVGPDYIVLEYVEGEPLSGPLSDEECIRLAGEILSAMEEAHSKGILHRDLKPGNILRTKKGSAKLLDFGLAKLLEDVDATMTQDGMIMGTPAYMSPEQARGEKASVQSDIFSFGSILYELISGQRAFGGPTVAACIHSVVSTNPARLDSNLWPVVEKCLMKDPKQRFASATEAKESLITPVKQAVRAAPSLVVLPFANMSRDADDEYFSDGLAEEIINVLVKVPGLKVIARTSAFAFKGQNMDVRKIAEILGVSYVLEGSVRRSGSRIRVTAQLIVAFDGTHLWSERYDRQMEDVFEMQDEIAAAIATELKLKFAVDSASKPRRQPDMRAYESYLRYRHYQWMLTPESLRLSKECLEQAIAIDPDFALPYVGLADFHLASTTGGIQPRTALEESRKLARRALQSDPDLSEAHGMMGIVAGALDRDWKKAGEHFQLAMANEPVHWHVRMWRSVFFYLPLDRAEDARADLLRCLEDNPLGQIVHANLGAALGALGLIEESRAAWRKSVELDPNFWYGWQGLGLFEAVSGDWAQAREAAERAYSLFPTALVVGLLAGILQRDGEVDRAAELMRFAPEGSYASRVAFSHYYLASGNFEKALEVGADLVIREGSPTQLCWTFRQNQGVLSQSPGWSAFLRKVNLAS